MKKFKKHSLSKQRFKLKSSSKTCLIFPILEPEKVDLLKKSVADQPSVIFDQCEIEINFDCFTVQEIITYVLPLDIEPVSNFATIGHICHLNLRPQHEPFQNLLAKIFLRKLGPKIRTILVKTNKIESTFRTLPLKVLAGEEDFICRHIEHGCIYQMDFSKVYWNSRLQEEHHLMVEFILQNFSSAAENGRKFSVIDACCGIGPFVIPLAKKKKNLEKYKNFDKILANDLNPDSVFYLKENIKLNKIDCQSVNIQVSEPVDGVEFIKNSLLGHDFSDQIVVILMNLPRFSVSLLMKNMVGCLVDISEERQAEFRKKFPYKITILAHHMSGRDQNDEKSVQAELPENFVLKEIWDVRKLIGEHYLRIMVEVPVEELFRRSAEPSAKKSKID